MCIRWCGSNGGRIAWQIGWRVQQECLPEWESSRMPFHKANPSSPMPTIISNAWLLC